jgi:ubiquinol-cytochrome c reductase cytochrome c1 subunit
MKTVSIKKIIASAAIVLGLMSAAPAMASGVAAHPRSGGFSFDGPFGTYDQGQLQRGYKVYHEVCAACHGIDALRRYLYYHDPVKRLRVKEIGETR